MSCFQRVLYYSAYRDPLSFLHPSGLASRDDVLPKIKDFDPQQHRLPTIYTSNQ